MTMSFTNLEVLTTAGMGRDESAARDDVDAWEWNCDLLPLEWETGTLGETLASAS